MSTVLYRKYRPTNFDEVVGQEHVVKTIQSAIKRGKVAHAYLFSGPRGTGKTTVARILAKTINCKDPVDGKPCNKCSVCIDMNQNRFLDLIEIDAATHTQVDKIRDLIEKINFAPTSGKYKVYIIDEVHMLSKGAFNALLKTLEEPPQHAVFILATTEAHKVPATIISRCQKFDFRRLKIGEIKKCLAEIAEKEGVKVEEKVFDFIATNSNGGLRDSQSLLGQILSLGDGEVTMKEVQEILAVVDIAKAIGLVDLIAEKKYSEAILYVNKINDDGYDSEQFAKSVVEYARKLILIKVSPEMKNKFSSELTEEQITELEGISKKVTVPKLVRIIRAFIGAKEEIRSAILPQLPLELAICEINVAEEEDPAKSEIAGHVGKRAETGAAEKEKTEPKRSGVAQSIEKLQNMVKESMGFPKSSDIVPNVEAEPEKTAEEPSEQVEVAGNNTFDLEAVKSEWCEILEEVKLHNHSLTAFLKTCQPVSVENNTIIISCQYSFHKDKLQKVSSKSIVEKVASEILKANVFLKFISKEDAQNMGYRIEEARAPKESSDLVNSALEMFGGEVVG
ncbi:MAG: DNA polymerase III subunit gamma/tau [Candidatus Paceibacterota bacterium]|jgi:DNA polymerase-3 subunit gamma/tau